MEQELQKKIEARFEELPDDVQRAIKSADVDKKIRDIAAKHQLHIDQSGALGDEVLMAMMGFSDMAEFACNIAEHVKVPAEKAEAMAQDIGTTLFIPIRKSMQEFTEQRALQETILAQKREAPAQAPEPAPAVPVPAKITAPAAPPPSFVPKPVVPHPADMMLSQKTVTSAPPKPPAPQPYKADPYREPTS